jgi:hypothetical protein
LFGFIIVVNRVFNEGSLLKKLACLFIIIPKVRSFT